jgi:hypothetical protein
LKLDNPIARRAVQVVVARRTVVVLERTPIRKAKFAQKTRFDQESQGAINGRPAHLMTCVVQIPHQLVSVEVLI